MKRKVLFIVLAVVMAVACSWSLIACKDNVKFEEGTYDLYFYRWDESRKKEIFVKTGDTFSFKDGDVYWNGKKSGTYKFEKRTVTVTLNTNGREKVSEFNYHKDDGSWVNLCDAFNGSKNSAFYKQGTAPKIVVDEDEYYNK